MVTEIIAKYVHFVAIFTIIGALVAELLLLKPIMARRQIYRLSVIDGIYGIASIVLLAAGLTLWFGVGKPASYYNHNWIFHLKIGLFLVVGLLSIRPTVFFLKQRKGDQDEDVIIPGSLGLLVRIEIALLFILPALATMMAKGLGSF